MQVYHNSGQSFTLSVSQLILSFPVIHNSNSAMTPSIHQPILFLRQSAKNSFLREVYIPRIPSYQITHHPRQKKIIPNIKTNNLPSNNLKKKKKQSSMMPPSSPSSISKTGATATAATTPLLLPIVSSTLTCLLLVLAASTPSSASPSSTLETRVSSSQTELPDLRLASTPPPSSACLSPIPNSLFTTKTPNVTFLLPQKEEYYYYQQQQQPTINGKEYEKKAAQKPGIIVVYVVCGVFVLVLAAAVGKTVMYRSRMGGYLWEICCM